MPKAAGREALISTCQAKKEQTKGNEGHHPGSTRAGQQRLPDMPVVNERAPARRRDNQWRNRSARRNHHLLGFKFPQSHFLRQPIQRLIHLPGSLETLLSMEAQRVINYRLQALRQRGIDLSHRLESKGKRRRRVSGDHLVEQHTQGKNIAAWVGAPVSFILLRRGVPGSAQRLGIAAGTG